MTKSKEIPLDWKIELDKKVNDLCFAADDIMKIIDTLPTPGKVFRSKHGDLKIEIQHMTPEEQEEYDQKVEEQIEP